MRNKKIHLINDDEDCKAYCGYKIDQSPTSKFIHYVTCKNCKRVHAAEMGFVSHKKLGPVIAKKLGCNKVFSNFDDNWDYYYDVSGHFEGNYYAIYIYKHKLHEIGKVVEIASTTVDKGRIFNVIRELNDTVEIKGA